MDTKTCTKCGVAIDVKQKSRLGLCVACYTQYRRARLALNEAKREAYDEEARRRGWIKRKTHRAADNDFADLAQTVAEEDGPFEVKKPRRKT